MIELFEDIVRLGQSWHIVPGSSTKLSNPFALSLSKGRSFFGEPLEEESASTNPVRTDGAR